MKEGRRIYQMILLGFLLLIPSITVAKDTCGVEQGSSSIGNARRLLDRANRILNQVDDCLGSDNFKVCRDAARTMHESLDNVAQVLAISRGSNCRYCDLDDIAEFSRGFDSFAGEINRKGYHGVPYGNQFYYWNYKTLAEEPRCSTSQKQNVPGPVVTPSPIISAVGAWSWFNGGVVTLTIDGNILSNNKKTGTYSCNGNKCTLRWYGGKYVDTLTISSDGQRLDGKNQNGTHVWGKKVN